MEQKRFEMPKHPTRGAEHILVERPSKESVWYLVVEKDKSIPLPTLKNPKNQKQVLDALQDNGGWELVRDYMIGGYSKD